MDGIVATPEVPADEQAFFRQIDVIAEIGYEAVRTQEYIAGEQAPAWCDLDAHRVVEIEEGVQFIVDNPNLPLSAQHDAWIERNRNRLAEDDPRLVPFDRLPFGMQLKARLWRHVVHAIIG